MCQLKSWVEQSTCITIVRPYQLLLINPYRFPVAAI
jgi:hypothetical protein